MTRLINYSRATCAVGLLLVLGGRGLAEDRGSVNAALDSITAAELKTHVEVLADDTFEGREAGSRGGRAAGAYLVSQFEKHHLRGAGDRGGYFQNFGAGYRNLLGLLEGSDPLLKDEVIVIAAHYDHVGYGSPRNSFGPTGYIHNGADDNASGTAGLLETMEAFVNLPQPPRRSILFALWDGEEKGLLGSQHWVTYPTIPLNRVKFMINVDMIGRLRKQGLEVYGIRTGNGLRRLVSENNHDPAVELKFTWEMKDNSDHYSFFNRNIPVLMLHTGLHEDYHRPSDDVERINVEGMRQVVRLMFSVSYDLAQRDRLAGFRPAARQESPYNQANQERPLDPAPPRLGVWWDKNSEATGLQLTRIASRSAAERAGFRVGDRLIDFAGKPITNGDEFVDLVMRATNPVEIVVERRGDTEPKRFTVKLDGTPVRVGLSWKLDAVEPGTALVSQVIAGSPAARAGLQTGDRIYGVAAKSFDGDEQLRQLLTTLPSPLDLLIERRGRLETLSLAVPAP